MAEVDVPAVGKVDRKWIYIGGAVVVGITAWWFLSGRDKAEAAATAEQDAAFNDAITGSVGGSGYVNPNPNAAGSGAVDSSGGDAIDTIPEWTDLVLSKLADFVEPGFLAGALGKYLAGQPLTAEEADVVRQAWAFAGKPPGGPSGYTLISDSSTPGTPTPPAPSPGTVVPRRPLPDPGDISTAPTTPTRPTIPGRRY